jgi:hypothetical protein
LEEGGFSLNEVNFAEKFPASLVGGLRLIESVRVQSSSDSGEFNWVLASVECFPPLKLRAS